MNENEKKEIAQRLSARVSTGLSFVEFNYLDQHLNPDPAWIRNIYILLSFYTELLLKAIFIIKRNFTDITDLDERLRKMGHNLEITGQQIGEDELLGFGIKNIQFIGHEYLIETKEGDFYVKDFTDIRYDFLDSRVRTLKGDEHEMFRRQIEIMLKINEELKLLIWQ